MPTFPPVILNTLNSNSKKKKKTKKNPANPPPPNPTKGMRHLSTDEHYHVFNQTSFLFNAHLPAAFTDAAEWTEM